MMDLFGCVGYFLIPLTVITLTDGNARSPGNLSYSAKTQAPLVPIRATQTHKVGSLLDLAEHPSRNQSNIREYACSAM